MRWKEQPVSISGLVMHASALSPTPRKPWLQSILSSWHTREFHPAFSGLDSQNFHPCPMTALHLQSAWRRQNSQCFPIYPDVISTGDTT